MRRVLSLAAGALLLALAVPVAAQDDLDEQQTQAIKAAVAKAGPAVVAIETSGGTDTVVAGPRGQRILKGTGPTTGLIVGADGYIISSSFNFANKPSSIIVSIAGQKEKLVAKVVGTDQTRMLTLLKVDATGLPMPVAAPKKDIKIGHTALALGRTLVVDVDKPPSVSRGIVSALERIWGKALQTDAKVSPTNYGGPLVDLQGRVMGVLVPASPNGEGETAGFEWYDSGIGFAIPLEDVLGVLPRMKPRQGSDAQVVLKKGVLGVTMRSRDMYGDEPVVGTVSPDSAAAGAGLKAGDLIVAIDGKDVLNYAQVLHRLGSKYEGDPVSIKIKRDGKEQTFDKVALGGAVASFNLPFLGILPIRDDPAAGVEVRYVFPKSPAETAGIKEGDRLMKVGADPARLAAIADRAALLTTLASARPGGRLSFEVKPKDGKEIKKITVTLGEYVTTVPEKLPEKASHEKALAPRGGAPAPPKEEKKDEKKADDKKEDEKGKAPTGFLKKSNVTRDHTYWVYVPENYNPNVSYALVIWLHPVSKNKEADMEKITDLWADYCSENKMIMVLPSSENETGWVGSEADFVQETAKFVTDNYTIDRRRVVAHGMGIGGQMAYYLGFSARDLVRGVAATAAVLTNNPKERVPTQPLSFYLTAGEKDPLAEAVKETREKLVEHKYPVIYREMKEKGHQYFDDDTEDVLKELVRWIDSLDRI